MSLMHTMVLCRPRFRHAAVLAAVLTVSAGAFAHAQPSTVVDVIRRNATGEVSVSEMTVHPDAVTSLVERLRAEPDVIAAGVSQRRQLVSDGRDPMSGSQWGLNRLGGSSLSSVGTGRGVVVAVLDTGVDASHPEFSGRVLPGWDAVSPGGDGRIDPNGHGTHVAGIVAAAVDGVGVQGLAPDASILPVRVLGADGFGDDTHLALGIIWAADNGADVMNLSIGGAVPSTLLEDSIRYAFDKGVLVVVAAGNDALSGNAPSYPAAYPETLAVGATDSYDRRSLFSNTGSYVDVAAPGSWILSTWPSGGYQNMSGTSMAAPFAAATAALVHERTGLSGRALRDHLTKSAYDIGPAGFDEEFGAGLVNPLSPIGSNPGPPPEAPSLPQLPLQPTLPELPPLVPPSLPTITLPPVTPLPTPSLPAPPAPSLPVTPPDGPVSPLPPNASPPPAATPTHSVTISATARRSGSRVYVSVSLGGSSALTARQRIVITGPGVERRVRVDWKGRATVRVTAPRGTRLTVTLAPTPLATATPVTVST